MRVWIIWIQDDYGHTWLHAAWDDDETAENPEGWRNVHAEARRIALNTNGYIRVQSVHVPGVLELFEVPEVEATP